MRRLHLAAIIGAAARGGGSVPLLIELSPAPGEVGSNESPVPFGTKVRWGTLEIQPRSANLGWELEETTRFEISYDYEVLAVEGHFRSPGIGLPVIAIREPPSGDSTKPQDAFRPRDTFQAVPVTLLVRLEE
ncbi:MAG: hypothetical protein IH851_13350, partial [Armatimonadetes bacterium]|nr:hypothetical protein [Armatimonadota bacterium]